ncbi:disks large -like protein [Labeo rohita]|uniref:Disks large-like protein n=1 Tax=Labeo rohita TaxID=84645 RepID=A0A498NES9_LABRO|nr:disks large -like protein [Labeo rohita]
MGVDVMPPPLRNLKCFSPVMCQCKLICSNRTLSLMFGCKFHLLEGYAQFLELQFVYMQEQSDSPDSSIALVINGQTELLKNIGIRMKRLRPWSTAPPTWLTARALRCFT